MCPAIIVKLRTFASMKTTNTAIANAPSSAMPDSCSHCSAMPAEQRERRVRDEVVEQVGAARAAAQRVGAGGGEAEQHGRAPGRAARMASTMPRNEPPIRKRLASSTMKSLPSTSTNSRPTIAGGSHCSSVESSAALAITTASSTDWPITANAAAARAQRRRGAAGRLRGALGRRRPRSAEPAARISASDQATITSHRTTASQTITDRKVVPLSPRCHRSYDWVRSVNNGVALECGAFHSADCSDDQRGGTKLRWGPTAGLVGPAHPVGDRMRCALPRSINQGGATRKERVMGWRN